MARAKQTEGEEGAGDNKISFKDTPPLNYFLQLGPAFKSFHHLSIVSPAGDQIYNT